MLSSCARTGPAGRARGCANEVLCAHRVLGAMPAWLVKSSWLSPGFRVVVMPWRQELSSRQGLLWLRSMS